MVVVPRGRGVEERKRGGVEVGELRLMDVDEHVIEGGDG